jgi:hypothetical protein
LRSPAYVSGCESLLEQGLRQADQARTDASKITAKIKRKKVATKVKPLDMQL